MFGGDKKEIGVFESFDISVEESVPLFISFFIRGNVRPDSLMILLYDDFSMPEVRMGCKKIL